MGTIINSPCSATLGAACDVPPLAGERLVLPDPLSFLMRHLRAWEARRRQIQALRALDDRLLRDVGLCADEVRSYLDQAR